MVRRRRMPDHVLVISEYLDELAQRGVAAFTVADLAAWLIDHKMPRTMRPKGPKDRERQLKILRNRASVWLQLYWRAQAEDHYRYAIDCHGWGASARWVFYVAGEDEPAASTAASNRVHKSVTVQLRNGLMRSVRPYLSEKQIVSLQDDLDVAVALIADRVMELVDAA